MPTLDSYLVPQGEDEPDDFKFYSVPQEVPQSDRLALIKEFIEQYPDLPGAQLRFTTRHYSDSEIFDEPNWIRFKRNRIESDPYSSGVWLEFALERIDEEGFAGQVRPYQDAAGITQPLSIFKKANDKFAEYYELTPTETLKNKKAAIKNFLTQYPRPQGTRRLGGLHIDVSSTEASVMRLLPVGRVKIVIKFANTSPVESQKDEYAISLFLEELDVL